MPTENEKFILVKEKKGWRVKSTTSERFFSEKPLTKKKALAQQRALYANVSGSGYRVRGGKIYLYKGNGFFSNAKSAFMKNVGRLVKKGESLVNSVRTRFEIRNTYPPKAREILQKFGEGQVEELLLRRQPIMNIINKALNFLTLGKWNEVRSKYNYDTLFHLSLVATVRMPSGEIKQIMIEKNQVITITDSFSSSRDIQFQKVVLNEPITLNEFMKRGEQKGGDKFFVYDAFNANCQMFLMNLLDANNLTTEATKEFILQPVSELVKELPSYTQKVARGLTDIASSVDTALFGKGDNFCNALLKTNRKRLKIEGGRTSDFALQRIQKQREFANLSAERQAEERKKAEERRVEIKKEVEEQQRKIREYNEEMRRRKASAFTPIVEGLTKIADFSAEKLAPIIGVPKIATEAYKMFAPPGSKFHGGKKDKWMNQIKSFSLTPRGYLQKARKFAKDAGYNPKHLTLSDDGKHKLVMKKDDGTEVRFGSVGKGDFILWSKKSKEEGEKKRKAYLARATKIKGDWKDDKFSKNNLAIRIGWGG